MSLLLAKAVTTKIKMLSTIILLSTSRVSIIWANSVNDKFMVFVLGVFFGFFLFCFVQKIGFDISCKSDNNLFLGA